MSFLSKLCCSNPSLVDQEGGNYEGGIGGNHEGGIGGNHVGGNYEGGMGGNHVGGMGGNHVGGNYDFQSNKQRAAGAPPGRPRTPVRWVVGLDFGTTYSGYGYNKITDKEVHVNVEWPGDSSGRFYCKNLTALYYQKNGEFLKCMSWGHRARSEFSSDKNPGVPIQDRYYLSKFKLLLKRDLDDHELRASIPDSLTVDQVIIDYLKLIGENVLEKLKHHDGNLFKKDSVQWSVSVPSIWDDSAKQRMKQFMVNAGLVSEAAGGADSVSVVLEPEAASYYCHEIMRQNRDSVSLVLNDKILVVDVGGGTVDIVMQEVLGSGDSYRVRELTESSGGLCGGTFVDEAFMRFMYMKVPVLEDYARLHPKFKPYLLSKWENLKCSFGHEGANGGMEIDLPPLLAENWRIYEKDRGRDVPTSTVELTEGNLMSIFDPIVNDILQLIQDQLSQQRGIKAMFVVGGFAGSRYLMTRIRKQFASSVRNIISPPNPGSAIITGAVYMARNPGACVERVLRKTYGTSVSLPFARGDPENLKTYTEGKYYCRQRFDKFVTKGDRIQVGAVVTRDYSPVSLGQDHLVFDLYSTDQADPRYVVDRTVTKEGQFVVAIPKYNGNIIPKFAFSLYFSGSSIELRAEMRNGSATVQSTSLSVTYHV